MEESRSREIQQGWFENQNIETQREANTSSGNENQKEVHREENGSIGNGHQYRGLVIDITKMLESLEPTLKNEYCIYRVPHHLRKLNDEAYTPRYISIGPFHHSDKRLQPMEKHKVRNLKSFMSRTNKNLDNLVGTIKGFETRIRRCYAETIELSSDDFVKLILMDGSFIVELFMRKEEGDNLELLDPLSEMGVDLSLLENQLPYFVIEKLFELLPPNRFTLAQLTFRYFSFYNIQNISHDSITEIKHFTDLLRTFQLPPLERRPQRERTMISNLYSLTQLCEAGVELKVGSSKCLLDLKFKNGVLEIPQLSFEDRTEVLVRNVMALELCHYGMHQYVTDYYQILDFLVDTTKDVDILCDKNIVVNYLGDRDAIKSLVNNLNKEIAWNSSSADYYKLCEELNAYYGEPWHRWKATLRRQYFSTPWRIASTIAAVILLVLTLIQTICSIIQILPIV